MPYKKTLWNSAQPPLRFFPVNMEVLSWKALIVLLCHPLMKLPLSLTVSCWLAWMVASAGAQQPDTLRHALPAPPTGAQSGAQLGWSVAVDDIYTVVGAPFDDIGGPDSGVVKVFHTTTGALLHVLANPTPASGDNFGYSVAVSGNRVVVGANRDDTAATNAGSVYVYDLSTGTPTVPITVLNKASPVAGDNFGNSVAISGTRVVVGAYLDDAGATDSGSAHVFDLTSPTPTVPVATLNNPSPGSSNGFGISVAISGNRVLVGAYRNDPGAVADAGAAYVYDVTNFPSTVPAYTLTKPIPTAFDNFGTSVAISGNLAVVGAPSDDLGAPNGGSAYVFDLGSSTPTVPTFTVLEPTPIVSNSFGGSVAISGNRLVVGVNVDDTGAVDAGRSYVFDVGNPTPVAILNNPSPATFDNFGTAVAISGNRVVVGAIFDDTGATDAGTAYGYDLTSPNPTVPAVTLNNPGPGSLDLFGLTVSVSGTRIVVGAPSENTSGPNTGSAYIYDLASPTPTVPIYSLNNPNPTAEDYFGISVGISGTRVIVGAYQEDVGATNAGSAYIYDLSSLSPTVPVTALHNPNPTADANFGNSVAISGNRAIVGAYRDDTGATDAGRAYVYEITSPTPTIPIAILDNPSPAAADYFGNEVAISGLRAVVGAYQDDTGAGNAGSAYIYDLPVGGPQFPVPTYTLNNPNPAVDATFGSAAAISGTIVVIGANRDDTGATDAGRAYVYDLTSGTPTVPIHALNNPTPAIGDLFANSVAVSGNRLIVGTSRDDTGNTNAGSAYIYDLTSGTPTVPVVTLNNPGTGSTVGDGFGAYVALDGTTAVVGAPFDDSPQADKGSAYVFGPADTTAPTGGTATLAPVSPVDGSAALGVTFAGWADPTLPLSYQVLVDNVPVALAGPSTTVNFIGPNSAGPHSLKSRIIDGLGNTAEVTQSFTVLTAQESWRRTYFGNPANSGPGADTEDPDGDGQVNLFEYRAGLVPIDASSRLALRVEDVPGQPLQKAIIFNPIYAGRTYTVKTKASLSDPAWVPLTSFTTMDSGSVRTVTDLNAGPGPRFYIVELTLP